MLQCLLDSGKVNLGDCDSTKGLVKEKDTIESHILWDERVYRF